MNRKGEDGKIKTERQRKRQEGDRPTDRGRDGHRDTIRGRQRRGETKTDQQKKGKEKEKDPERKMRTRQKDRLEKEN